MRTVLGCVCVCVRLCVCVCVCVYRYIQVILKKLAYCVKVHSELDKTQSTNTSNTIQWYFWSAVFYEVYISVL